MGNLGGWEIVIILGVLVLLFGAKRLPDMARSVGQSARVFKGEMKGLKNEDQRPQERPVAEPGPVGPARTVDPAPQARTERVEQRGTETSGPVGP